MNLIYIIAFLLGLSHAKSGFEPKFAADDKNIPINCEKEANQVETVIVHA